MFVFEGLSFDSVCKYNGSVESIIIYSNTHRGELSVPKEVCMTSGECTDMLEFQSMKRKIVVEWNVKGGVITIPIPLTTIVLRCVLISIININDVNDMKDEIFDVKEEHKQLKGNIERMDILNTSLQHQVDRLVGEVLSLRTEKSIQMQYLSNRAIDEINNVELRFSKCLNSTDIERFQHVNVLFGKTLYEHLLIRVRFLAWANFSNHLSGVVFDLSNSVYIRELPICEFVEGLLQEGLNYSLERFRSKKFDIRVANAWINEVFSAATELKQDPVSYNLSLDHFGTFSVEFLEEMDQLYFKAYPIYRNNSSFKSFTQSYQSYQSSQSSQLYGVTNPPYNNGSSSKSFLDKVYEFINPTYRKNSIYKSFVDRAYDLGLCKEKRVNG